MSKHRIPGSSKGPAYESRRRTEMTIQRLALNIAPKHRLQILARKLPRWLRQVILEHLQHTQFFGVLGNSILDGASQTRYVIAHAKKQVPIYSFRLCIFTKPLTEPRLPVPHLSKIPTISRFYRTPTRNVQRRHCLNTNKRHNRVPITIQCGVREGCPLRVALYALCLRPLLNTLYPSLQGHGSDGGRNAVPFWHMLMISPTQPSSQSYFREYNALKKLREHSSILPNRKPWPLAFGKRQR